MMMIATGADLIDALVKDNHNTVIFYENIYPALSIFKRILNETEGELTILAISNPVMKTLREISAHTDVDLSKARIVTLNLSGNGDGDVAFSYNQIDELTEYIKGLRGTLIILCRGLLKIIVEDYQKMFFRIIESIGDDLKIIAFTAWKSYSNGEIATISGMFDVAIHIRKMDNVFSFGEEVYELNVIQSIVPYIQPGTVYFKVGANLEMEEHG
ncbi:hypothetical protein GAH_01798 [Geoglobus ahangari]|uniref:Uncharacterized protein n=1 Tax=Geoglobus ahangari TaxID=113653 RepID=A0A0F7IE19_9EURY|nr:hypothetical protein [Geoglobus ahangari]AKG90923.1 hypothetical protein GAH_01798 [Geoglobus ahangari]